MTSKTGNARNAIVARPRPATEQQSKAITTRGVSVVLASGAGCGKTRVLTDRYLSHLEKGEADPSRLVAITFTDKAAREMRGRIRKAVEAKLPASTGAERDRWRANLLALETAWISTIHAFCATLLRQHSLAAGLDPRFIVLEAPMAANLRSAAVRESLTELLTNGTPAGDDLHELVRIYGWSRVKYAIAELLERPDVAGWENWAAQPADELAATWQKRLKSLLASYVEYLIRSSGPIGEAIRLLKSTPCRGPKMSANVQRLLELLPKLASADNIADAILEILAAAKVQGTEGKDAWDDADTYEQIKDALTQFRTAIKNKFEQFIAPPENLAPAAAVARRFLRVAIHCQRAYDEEKRRLAGLDFQDLLVAARNLLRDHHEVRSLLRHRIEFLLVDELQDTDQVQMELVEHLCGSGLTAGKLFAVGDAKQSIYRFRGAVVELFRGLACKVPALGQQTLTDNFRSQLPILHFVNALLSKHMDNYDPLRNGLAPVGNHECVELLWSPAGDDDVETNRRREAETIARRIAKMISPGEKLATVRPDGQPASLRPVQAGDIVLLFRAMTNVHMYEAALQAQGLDYYVVGGRAFFSQQEVFDLYHLLQALENPQDGLSLAATLRSPFGCLGDDTLVVLASHERGIWAGLHDESIIGQLSKGEQAIAVRVRRWLDSWRSLKDRIGVPELLARILADSGYDAALQFEHLGIRKLANLWKLQELARTFDRGRFGLADFIRELAEMMDGPQREEQAATQPEESNVIRLMSIHQAKGLEFPVVFLPDIAAKSGGDRGTTAVWDQQFGCVPTPPSEDDPPLFSKLPRKLWEIQELIDGWHEDLRTLYVACTRARDYLVLSGSLAQNAAPQNTAMVVLTERFNLQNGQCSDSAIAKAEVPRVVVPPFDATAVPALTPTRVKIAPLTPADRERIADAPTPVACGVVRPDRFEFDEKLLRRRRVREVLKSWDIKDAAGWRNALAAMPVSADDRKWLKAGYERFAKSEVFAKCAAASRCYQALDFALTTDGPVACGVIDLLWQDASGWHLAEIRLEGVPDEDTKLAVQAIQQQSGKLPTEILTYHWESGETESHGSSTANSA